MTLKTQAIYTALGGDWNTAISLNLELLKENPSDIETLNRLAFAYIVLGKTKDAKNIYQKVLKLDGQNPIALKNLKRLIGTTDKKNGDSLKNRCFVGEINSIFIEETGKTKVIELINVADPKIISHLMIGELLALSIKRLKIFILDQRKQYIGMLPDDIGKRLIKFLKGGNRYQAFVKAVENHRVIIFIKEEARATRFKNQPSFYTSMEKTKNAIPTRYYDSLKESEESSDDGS